MRSARAAAEQVFELAAGEGSGPLRGQFQLLTTVEGAIGVMVLLPVRSQYQRSGFAYLTGSRCPGGVVDPSRQV